MPQKLPTIEKEWQFAVNQIVEGHATVDINCRRVLWAIKESLKGFPQNPWEVLGSSDAVTAGMDGVDRWTADTKIIPSASGNRSWIVLRQPGTDLKVLLSQSFGSVSQVHARFSLGSFTGGSISAPPTATLTANPLPDPYWYFPQTAARRRLHVMHSADGKNTMVFVLSRYALEAMMMFGEAADPVAGWSTPVYGYIGYYNMGNTILRFTTNSGNVFHSFHGGAVMSMYTGWPGMGDFAELMNYCEWSEHPLVPSKRIYFASGLGLFCNTSGKTGRHGRLPDIWAAPQAVPSGTAIPRNTKRFAKLAAWLVPWPGTSLPDVA